MINYDGYWLVYVNASSDQGPPQLTAIPVQAIDRGRLARDAQAVLVAADTYHDLHPAEQVVFFGELTRWLLQEKGLTWGDLSVDFEAALAYLDEHVPNFMLDADPVTARTIANPADTIVFVLPGGEHAQPADMGSIKQMILDVVEGELAAQ